MKRQSEIKERQNDEKALTLLRASERCLGNERVIKYIMIFMSFSICLAAIFNRYLPQLLPSVENVEELQSTIATYLNLISGVVLVCSIVLGFYVFRMHTEGTVLQDRYEAYVFDNPANLSVLRPIPQTIVEIYAKKTRRQRNEKFLNAIYGEDDTPSANYAQYEYIKKEISSDYKLYIYVQPFFLTIWIGFCILVMIIAVSFNDRFITTLINILIPSLSAISTIANSWHNCRLQIRQLQNLQNIIDDIQSMPESRRLVYISDKHNVRLLADGLFAYRVSAFVIPKFLKRRYLKSEKMASNSLHKQVSLAPVQSAEPVATKKGTDCVALVAVGENDRKTETAATAVTHAACDKQVKNKETAKTVALKPVNRDDKEKVKPAAAAKTAAKKPVKPVADNETVKRNQKNHA